ncbi:crotonase/enoyl-CoA hydratase family protein [Variovorax sp. J31P207]|uniref:crotonase/enoyl-CoA hydratase family protein n=1 Tax=Variovorax sp. J31P207 TaxID=3053510 RepID=UPI002575F43A|nr:crotonase/enoyl-CoA hydratase family protein [Variovorax sp. J31P207]MDM0072658.1 crotonase/enoyl-CoA hydratase family protein [Variovorax sp. J31P207]
MDRHPDIQEELLVQEQGDILLLTLNRPQARNAATLRIAQAMAAAIDEFEARSDLCVAVVTGAGGNFCSGMDLKGFLRGEKPRVEGRGFAGITERPPVKPIIAAVEGYALAGGFELALACDLIVASEDARFGLPEAKRGLVATAGGLVRLPRQLPQRIAMELAMTGEPMPAARLHACGLINQLVPAGQALDRAIALARSIAQNSPLAVTTSKAVILQSGEWPAAELFERQRQLTDPVFASPDAREGAAAFAEKRKPVWQSSAPGAPL